MINQVRWRKAAETVPGQHDGVLGNEKFDAMKSLRLSLDSEFGARQAVATNDSDAASHDGRIVSRIHSALPHGNLYGGVNDIGFRHS